MKNTFYLFVTLILMLPVAVGAQSSGGGGNPPPPIEPSDEPTESLKGSEIFTNPLGEGGPDSVVEFLNVLLEAVVTIMIPIVVLALIYTGFLFVKAGGDTNEIQQARTAFFWTVIGALIVLGAQALSLAIEGTVEQIRGNTSQPVYELVEYDPAHPDRKHV